MNYPYSQVNRLENSHDYMYTEFQGEAFLDSYYSSRLAVATRRRSSQEAEAVDQLLFSYSLPFFRAIVPENALGVQRRFLNLIDDQLSSTIGQTESDKSQLESLSVNLGRISRDEPILTLDLLHALISAQLTGSRESLTKCWLDRLIQRFEVTKRLYHSYPAGFRKGEGDHTDVRLYWLFALTVCLQYAKARGLKNLNALLKANDLLCSLPADSVTRDLPVHGLQTVVLFELTSIKILAEDKGVSFADG